MKRFLSLLICMALLIGGVRVAAAEEVSGWGRDPEIIVPNRALKIGVGETIPLMAFVEFSAREHALSYAVKSKSIAQVSDSGMVTGKKAGSTLIRISGEGLQPLEVSVRVYSKPTGLSVTPSATVISVGQPASVGVKFKNSKQGGSVRFSSSDENVLRVDWNGNLTAIAPGTAEIAATAYNGVVGRCTVQVKPAPEGIVFAQTQVSLGVGQTHALNAAPVNDSVGGITYTSSDAQIASVAADGTLKAVKAGEAVITATTYNGHAAECVVTVLPSPTAVKLNMKSVTLGVGETSEPFEVDMGGRYDGGYAVKTSSSKVAALTEDQRIIAKRTGSATITVRSYNGKTAKSPSRCWRRPRNCR